MYTKNAAVVGIVSSRGRLSQTLHSPHEFPQPDEALPHLQQAAGRAFSSVLLSPLRRRGPAPVAVGRLCGALSRRRRRRAAPAGSRGTAAIKMRRSGQPLFPAWAAYPLPCGAGQSAHSVALPVRGGGVINASAAGDRQPQFEVPVPQPSPGPAAPPGSPATGAGAFLQPFWTGCDQASIRPRAAVAVCGGERAPR
jgi:hypothetical protein